MRAGVLAVVLVGACARPPPPEACDAARQALRQGLSHRVHGLTQSDDVQETLDILGRAAACAPGDPEVAAHVELVRARLEARGQAEEMLVLARTLGPAWAPQEAALREQVRRGAGAAQQRLEAHVAALQQAAPSPAERWRAQRAAEAWTGAAPAAPAEETRVVVNHVSPQDSCVSVALGTGLPAGMALFSLRRGSTKLGLLGDSPAVSVAPDKTPLRPLWFCTAGEVTGTDRAVLELGGQEVWSAPVDVTPEARARGVAVAVWRRLPVDASACRGPLGPEARAACGLRHGGAP